MEAATPPLTASDGHPLGTVGRVRGRPELWQITERQFNEYAVNEMGQRLRNSQWIYGIQPVKRVNLAVIGRPINHHDFIPTPQ